MFGILSVTVNDTKTGFNRRWVKTPDGEPVLFFKNDDADYMADGMTAAARDANILDVGYRARFYDGKASINA